MTVQETNETSALFERVDEGLAELISTTVKEKQVKT